MAARKAATKVKAKPAAQPSVNLNLPPKVAPLFQPGKRFYSLRGGRGSSKSHSAATFFLLEGMKKTHRFLCAREYQNSISDSVLALLEKKIETLGLGSFYQVQRNTIIGQNGTEFIFAGLRHNIQSIKSMEGVTGVWLEEAQTISEDSYQILLPTIREPGSFLVLTWNPDSKEDPTYERFVTNKGDDCVDIELNWSDNPYWNETLEGERLRDKARLSDDDYSHTWEGKCKALSNARMFADKVVVEEFQTPLTARFFFGLDHGFANDPECLVRMFVKDGCLHIDHEAYAVGVDIDKLPEFLDKVPQSRRWVMQCDSARPEINSHLRGKGFRAVSAEKWSGSVNDGIAFLRGFKQIRIHPRCPNAAKDFKRASWKVDRLTKEVLPVPAPGDDHACDAARYALSKLIRKKGTSLETWIALTQD